MSRRRSRALTLIEVLVVCLILGTAFGGIALFSHRAFAKMRFEKAAGRVVATIKQKKMQALVQDKDLLYKLTWPGVLLFNGKETEAIDFTFYCNGTIWPVGSLELQMGERTYAITIS